MTPNTQALTTALRLIADSLEEGEDSDLIKATIFGAVERLEKLQADVDKSANEYCALMSRYDAVTQDRDELAAHVEQLHNYIERGSPINLNPDKCERAKLLVATPAQHLAEVKAKAGRAGFVAGLFSELHCPTTVWNREERADEYANTIRSEADQ